MYIRTAVQSKKYLILEVYAYLRDAAKKGFMDVSMHERMWTEIHSMRATLDEQATKTMELEAYQSPKPDVKEKANTACHHCGSLSLHQHCKVSDDKSACPLAAHSAADAKALRKKILVHFHRNRSKSIEAAIEKMVAEGA